MFKKLFIIGFLLSFALFANNKTLVKKGKKGIFFPAMASSWVSLNSKTVEVNLAPGVNVNYVKASLKKYLKRAVIEKKGRGKILITSTYNLEQLLNRLTVLPIKKIDLKKSVASKTPMDLIKEPGGNTKNVSLIEDEKVKDKNYFMGKVIKTKDENFPGIQLKIRITKSPANNKLGLKKGDVINAKPYIKIKDGNPDTTDNKTNENIGALFLQKNDRIDAVIDSKDKNSYRLLKVQAK